jgi:predicted ester cyclase
MEEVSHTLVRRLFEDVFNERRYDELPEIVGERYADHALAPFGEQEPGDVNGPAHLRQVVEWLRSQFPDVRMRLEAVVAQGDHVAARVRSDGTNLGALGGAIPPTGRRFDAEQTHWFRVAGGRLVEHWAVRDDLRAMVQLGLIPRPAGG